MVYGSLPAYLDLDPPLSWINEHLLSPGTPRSGQPAGSDAHPDQLPPRPGSTSERERPRLPKLVHQPDQPLNCPRCDSTNTKFCYFNNYSLSQPRHFCKTCRRYWTRGGALRNVPVGGGCRRNKRGKITASKSSTNSSNNHHAVPPPTLSGLTSTSSSTTGVGAITSSSSSSHMLISTLPQIPAMSSSTNVVGLEYGGGGILQGAIGQMMGGAPISSSYGYGGLEQWRSQFSFFSGLDQMITSAPPSTRILSPFNANGNATPSVPIKQHDPPLKMDETSQQRLNMPRQYWGNTSSLDDDHYSWGYGGSRSLWTDLPGFNPSSTNNLL